MSKRIFIDGSINSELCIISADGQEINYFDYSDGLATSKKNNIYLGTVSRVEPSLQAAFIEFGSEKKAFLPFDEIHPSYFKLPHNEKILSSSANLPTTCNPTGSPTSLNPMGTEAAGCPVRLKG